MGTKYPRTPHLPWSPGGTNDDRRLTSVEHLLDKPLVITEKMDGSNVCLQHDAVYARSHSSVPKHPSFNMLKALHARVKYHIPKGIQIFGEWLFAEHSIHYEMLPGYLMIFGVRDLEYPAWLGWDTVQLWAEELGIHTVPVLGHGPAASEEELRSIVGRALQQPLLFGKEREGCVVRLFDDYKDKYFERSIAKYVRAGHIQTDEHWTTKEVVRNGLRT